MNYDKKTKKDLILEVKKLKRRVTKLEKERDNLGHSIIDTGNKKKKKGEFVDLLPNAVFEIDMTGNVLFANLPGLSVFGLNKDDLKKGISCFDLIAPKDHARLQDNIMRIYKKEKVEPLSYTGRKKDGTTIPVVIQGSHISKAGKVVGVRGVIVDISQVEKAKKLIEEAKNNLEETVKVRSNELRLSNDKLERILDETISALTSAVETRDPYTAGHQQRVSQLAVAIGKKMGFSLTKIKGLAMAAMVHDIGKIYVPAEILSKPTKLSNIEFEIIRYHSKVGYDILKSIEFPWPIAKIVLQHHERLDGTGYPDKLKAKDILLESKIIAVADVVEAMASHRPYRPALGMKKALAEIKKNKDTLYDKSVVDTCTKIITKTNFEFTYNK